jgi:hypothetical protein
MGLDLSLPFANFPLAVAGGGGDYYFDYYWQNSGQLIAFLGGLWLYGSHAGLSTWYLAPGSGPADVAIGGRLLKKAL